MAGINTWFDDIWEKGTGLLDTWLDFEGDKFKSELAMRRAEYQSEQTATQAPSNYYGASSSLDMKTVFLVGAIGLGALIILKK